MERRGRLRKIMADMDDDEKVEKLGEAWLDVLLWYCQSHFIH